MNKIINQAIPEAIADGFTVAATGTDYSEEVDISLIDSTKTMIVNTAVVTSGSGATLNVTVQSYIHTLGWVDTAVTWACSIHSTASQTIVTPLTQGALGTRIRLKVIATGTFGGSESHVVAFYIAGKQ